MITYIDFDVPCDSVSHKFLDLSLAKTKSSRKTRSLFRSIYPAAQVAVDQLVKYYDKGGEGVHVGEIKKS